MNNVLIVDDDQDIIEMLTIFLEEAHYNVLFANNGVTALDTVRGHSVDIILLDIMMPEMNGFQFIKVLRSFSMIPVIFLTAKINDSDKVLGLQLGADDYIEKPFNPLEVNARVMANLRRVNQFTTNKENNNQVLFYNNLKLDLTECILYNENKRINLTSTEFKVLKLFMSSPGRVFTKQQIFEAGWENNIVDDNSIMVCISKLRSKLGSNQPRIVSIRGLGYRLEKV